MTKSRVSVLLLLIVVVVVAVLLAHTQPENSASGRKFLIFFGASYIGIAVAAFVALGKRPVHGLFFLPRGVWVVVACWGIAFAALMLVSVLAMPWIGFKGFELMFGEWSWIAMVALAIVAYPIVRKRLS
jgi:hypothetical protein